VKLWQRLRAWGETSNSLLAHWLRAAHDALLGEMPILAAGTALFALTATVPTLAAVVAVYGMVADPHQISSHLRGLETVLPPDVVVFIGGQLERQATRSQGTVSLALAISIIIAVVSARGAGRALIDTLNRAYRVRERRGALQKFLITLAMASFTLVGLMVMFGVVVALPGLIALFGLSGMELAQWLRWPVLMAVMFAALLALYRFAPSPRPLGTERHLWPGALTATILVVLVSWGLSQWVERFATYDVVYGAFGSVVVILLWFYASVMSLVIGGFVNAELERHAGAPAPDRSMY
jgi:membrane protein